MRTFKVEAKVTSGDSVRVRMDSGSYWRYLTSDEAWILAQQLEAAAKVARAHTNWRDIS